jgi:adenylosuccinate synthase
MASALAEFGRAVSIVDDRAAIARRIARSADLRGRAGSCSTSGGDYIRTPRGAPPAVAQALLREAGAARHIIGAVRAYATRHGAGPLPTEDPGLTIAEPHSGTGRYQGDWRIGHLDLPLLRYAAQVCRRHGGLDAWRSATSMSRTGSRWRVTPTMGSATTATWRSRSV